MHRLFTTHLCVFSIMTALSVSSVAQQRANITPANQSIPSSDSTEGSDSLHIHVNALSQRFDQFSDSYYRDLAKSKAFKRADSTEDLKRNYLTTRTNRGQHYAIALLYRNADILEFIGDASVAGYFIEQLLHHNALVFAKQVKKSLDGTGNTFVASAINYHFAVYYYQQADYERALSHALAIQHQAALSKPQQDYAKLIFAAIFQHKKQHRKALKVYAEIDAESSYFRYARLNEAVSLIRQDWWTDAHISINRALEHNKQFPSNEMENRLLLVLGYAQLKNAFYRDARDTFRKIKQDSKYVDRALLGIGICALHQNDIQGALNIFEALKNIDRESLSVMESYIMIPIAYERQFARSEALKRFNEAIVIYDTLLTKYRQQLATASISAANAQADQPDSRFSGGMQAIYKQFALLNSMPEHNAISATNTAQKRALLTEHQHLLQRNIKQQLRQKIQHIESYQSQAQYGVARLYDNGK